MRKTLSIVVLSVAFALLTAMAAAQDAKSCTDATLHGSFGLRATGNNTASGPTVAGGAVIVLGRFTFDGQGNLTAKLWTRAPSGALTMDTYTGQYSVDEDCIVTDSWTSSGGVTTTHVSVIVNNGKGYYVLNTTNGAPIISGEAIRQ
jgi:hypothetical protein